MTFPTWTAPFPDGWWAEANARGDLGCGGGGVPAEHVPPIVRLVSADRQTVLEVGPGRAVGWFDDEQFAYLPADAPTELWAATLRGEHVRLAHDAGGNTVRATTGHWLAVAVQAGGTGWAVYNGTVLYRGRLTDSAAVADEQALHTILGSDNWPSVIRYVSGKVQAQVRLPSGGNSQTLSTTGLIGAGYWGESYLLRPGATVFENVTVTPWRMEGPPTPATAPDGTIWLWSSTVTPSGRALVLGRPLGATDCVQVPVAATWIRVRVLDGQWFLVLVDGNGALTTVTVPLDAPRTPITIDAPPAPVPPTPPVPPPPPAPVPVPVPVPMPVPVPVPVPPMPERSTSMVFSNRPMFSDPAPTGWEDGTLNANSTASFSDGAVLSVQPNGSYERRPAGTAGAYEVHQRSGDKLIYRPAGRIYVVLLAGA